MAVTIQDTMMLYSSLSDELLDVSHLGIHLWSKTQWKLYYPWNGKNSRNKTRELFLFVLQKKQKAAFLRYYHSYFSTFQKFELFMKVNLLKASAV